MDTKKMLDKAEALLGKCEVVVLSSVSGQGAPRPCVVSKVKNEGIRKVYMSTGLNGTKARQFLKNPRAGLCYCLDGDSVTMTGEVSVLTDPTTKKAMWVEGFEAHFPGGVEDPNYCVLEFRPDEATLWIGREFVTLKP